MIYANKKNHLIVGRAATGIYLILKNSMRSKRVLLPANICYAAVFPVVYSNSIPIFCDVDCETGNVTFEEFKRHSQNIDAAIIPHMYGNPNQDIEKISDYCKKNRILFIEDCASCAGAVIGNRKAGSFGDYSVFSFGYSKTVELGNGGLIESDYDLSVLSSMYNELPLSSEKTDEANKLFSREYRAFRNRKVPLSSDSFYQIVKSDLFDNFIYRIDDSMSERIKNSVNDLEHIIIERRKKADLYNQLIKYNDNIFRYHFDNGAVPWRQNVFVRPEIREKLISYLLEQGVPVSDWYPVITTMFDDNTVYPNAEKMEKMILNFPLLIPDEEIASICEHVNLAVEQSAKEKI